METWQLIGLFMAVFGASWAVASFRNSRPRQAEQLREIPENAKLRLIAPGGSYRSRFISLGSEGLVVSAPLQQSHFVPLHESEKIVVQIPLADGILTFHTDICERRNEGHELVLRAPERVRKSDRRSEPRYTKWAGLHAAINGRKSEIVDLSAGGARIYTDQPISAGDHIRVSLPEGLGEAWGWALETIPASRHAVRGAELRIQFEAPLSGLISKTRV